VRQELASEHGIVIGLRSVEKRVQGWRREVTAQKRATVRFETRPGHQLQIDFGDTKVWIGDERIEIHPNRGARQAERASNRRAGQARRRVAMRSTCAGASRCATRHGAELLSCNARAPPSRKRASHL